MYYLLGGDSSGKSTAAAALSAAVVPGAVWRPSSSVWMHYVPSWKDGRDLVEWWSRRAQHRDEWVREGAALEATTVLPCRKAWLYYRTGHRVYDGLRDARELDRLLLLPESSPLRPRLLMWVGPMIRTTVSADEMYSAGTPYLDGYGVMQRARDHKVPFLHVYGREDSEEHYDEL